MNNDNTTVSNPSASNNTETLMNATVRNEICDLVETRINAGERVTILNLAKEKNISVNEIRNALVENFGNRVQFKRGRTGGIVLA
jgi:DNA-binding GntR family transcriptional regulator